MSVSTIAAVATDLTQNRTDQTVGVAVLRKALDIEAQNAATLIDAVSSSSSSANLPSYLGQNVNTTA